MNIKKCFIGIFITSLIIALTALGSIGCKTVVSTGPSGEPVTNKVVNAAAIVPIINGVVPVAVQVAIIKETNSVPYFQAATVVIDTLVNSGVYDPARLQAALSGLKVSNQDAVLAIQAGLSIYKSFAAEAVAAKLTQTEYATVLKAFSDAVKQGLMFSLTPGGKAMTIKVK